MIKYFIKISATLLTFTLTSIFALNAYAVDPPLLKISYGQEASVLQIYSVKVNKALGSITYFSKGIDVNGEKIQCIYGYNLALQKRVLFKCSSASSGEVTLGGKIATVKKETSEKDNYFGVKTSTYRVVFDTSIHKGVMQKEHITMVFELAPKVGFFRYYREDK